MNKKLKKIMCMVLMTLFCVVCCRMDANAYGNYEVMIIDASDLFTDAEKENLRDIMYEVSEYGNVALVTMDNVYPNTEEFAAEAYYDLFGTDSGTLFLIDMDNRYLWIHSDGAMYKTISKGYANTITDNVYRYASDGDYFRCAQKTFEQMLTLLKGGKIAQPMKVICNLILSLIVAVIINFWFVSRAAGIKKRKQKELLAGISHYMYYTDPVLELTRRNNTGDATMNGYRGSGGGGRSSGGSFRSYGGGFRSSGGGFRGGGRSGGGGGHRF